MEKNQNQNDELQAKRAKRQEFFIALIVCGLIFISSFFAANHFIFDELQAQIDQKQQKLSEIKANNKLLQQVADNRLELDKQTNEINEAYKKLAPLVPEETELPVVLAKIQDLAISRGLRLENFTPKPQVKKDGALSEIPITIELMGDDTQLKIYLLSLESLKRILHLNSLKTTKIEQGQFQGNVKAQLELSAYVSNIQNADLNKNSK